MRRSREHVRTVVFSPLLVEGQHGGAVVVHDAGAAAAIAAVACSPSASRLRQLMPGGRDGLPHVGEVAVGEGRARPADALPPELGEHPPRRHPHDAVQVRREAARPHAPQAHQHLRRHHHHHAHLHLSLTHYDSLYDVN
ncbi:Os03g0332201 [Oryza sativa Japonica Group]|uniref:Os03g0332201 protein n=1 Tax=Oryza sativa subsp. japonica TaxID=39947 RepID=A0A0P0VXY5_ORYSJ|nr:hypothetical protein EE612_017209 [Oryza sativa]BAS84038.1 Os03g0332201 [Oryza sativa Japonica Group]